MIWSKKTEPEGGPIADEYGAKLNRIDKAIAKLSGRKEMTYDQAIAEDIDLGHQDNEPGMIKAQLYHIGSYAMELYKMMDGLEEYR